MGQVTFGIHTGEFKKWVTMKEANSIKKFFGLNITESLVDETHFYEKGITKLWIEEIHSKQGVRYYLYMRINFSRAIGTGDHRIMPYSIANVKKAFKAINRILKILSLSDKNNKFSEWTADRLDIAFDVSEQNASLLMYLLNCSLDLSDPHKKCKRVPIPNRQPEQLLYESMRFGNGSYVFNIYVKLTEVLYKAREKGVAVTQAEIEEVRHIVRIERQNHGDAVKKLLLHRKVGDLTTDKVRENILRVMIDEVGLFFGKGDFYSWKGIERAYLPKHEADIRLISDAMKQITNGSLESAGHVYTKEISDIFAKLGLSPVGIKKDDAERYGVDWIQGIHSRVNAEYPRPPDKRQYNIFPVPHQTKNDGRIGANITFYSISNGKKTVSIRGNTLEDYESKVFRKLSETYLINRQYLKSDDIGKHDMLMKSADAVKRFHRAAKTMATKRSAEQFIERVIGEDERIFFGTDHSS